MLPATTGCLSGNANVKWQRNMAGSAHSSPSFYPFTTPRGWASGPPFLHFRPSPYHGCPSIRAKALSRTNYSWRCAGIGPVGRVAHPFLSLTSGGCLTGFLSGPSAGFGGFTNSFTYKKRLQPLRMSATFCSPVQTIFYGNYDFHAGNGDNSNGWSITQNRDNNSSPTYNYDALNRLISAQNTGTDCSPKAVNNPNQWIYWGNNYGYDAWANLLSKTVTKCLAEPLSAIALPNNRLSGYSYDPAGNMTNDGLGHSMTFDAENRISQVNSGAVQYTYDPVMGRVRKDVTGQPSTEY